MATPFKSGPDYSGPSPRGRTRLIGAADHKLEGPLGNLNELPENVCYPTYQVDVRPSSGLTLSNPGAEFAGPNDLLKKTEQIRVGPSPGASQQKDRGTFGY